MNGTITAQKVLRRAAWHVRNDCGTTWSIFSAAGRPEMNDYRILRVKGHIIAGCRHEPGDGCDELCDTPRFLRT